MRKKKQVVQAVEEKIMQVVDQISNPIEREVVVKPCNCNHSIEMHYGGPKGWCNTSGCKCEEYRP